MHLPRRPHSTSLWHSQAERDNCWDGAAQPAHQKRKVGTIWSPRLLQLPSTQKQLSGSPMQLQLKMLEASHSTTGLNTCSCKINCLMRKWKLLGAFIYQCELQLLVWKIKIKSWSKPTWTSHVPCRQMQEASCRPEQEEKLRQSWENRHWPPFGKHSPG